MHIFMIRDYLPDQETGEHLDFIGRIFLEDHMKCFPIFEIAQKYDCDIHPFEDVRLKSYQVSQLFNLFNENKGKISAEDMDALERILDILCKATEHQSGLLSFCD